MVFGAKCPCTETALTRSRGITYIYTLHLYIITLSLCILNYCSKLQLQWTFMAPFIFPFRLCYLSHVVTGDNIFCNEEKPVWTARDCYRAWSWETVYHAQESTKASANLLHVPLRCKRLICVWKIVQEARTAEYFKLHLTFTHSQETAFKSIHFLTNIFLVLIWGSLDWTLRLAWSHPAGPSNYGQTWWPGSCADALVSNPPRMRSEPRWNQTAPAILGNVIIIWPSWPRQEPH